MTDSRLNEKDRGLEPLRLVDAHLQRAIWLIESNFTLNEDYARGQLKREVGPSR